MPASSRPAAALAPRFALRACAILAAVVTAACADVTAPRPAERVTAPVRARLAAADSGVAVGDTTGKASAGDKSFWW